MVRWNHLSLHRWFHWLILHKKGFKSPVGLSNSLPRLWRHLIYISNKQKLYLLTTKKDIKYQLKNKYPPLAENVAKGYRSVVTHVLYHFCDMSLITACEIFCSLKFHIVCTCTLPLLWHGFDFLIDSRFLVFNIWASHALEMTINLYYPTFELFCFSFTQPFTHSKYPTLFSSVPPPAINNDRSLPTKFCCYFVNCFVQLA